MKKLLVMFGIMFLFVVTANAKVHYEFEEFQLSEDVELEAISFGFPSSGFFLALGKEYVCTNYNDPARICNVYSVDRQGNVTKTNKYYDNDKPNFPQNGHHHLKLVGNELKKYYVEDYLDDYKGQPPAGVDAGTIINNRNFNYLACYSFDGDLFDAFDICEVGVDDDGVQKYGIIDTRGIYSILPDEKYSLVYDEGDIHPGFAALKDNDGNYYIVSDYCDNDCKPYIDVLTEDYLNSHNIDIKRIFLVERDDDANYYAKIETGEVLIGGLFFYRYFTSSEVSSYRPEGVHNGVQVILTDNKPAFYVTDSQDNNHISLWNGNILFKNINNPIFPVLSSKLFFFSQNDTFYATNLNYIVGKLEYRENAGAMQLLGATENQNMYLFKDNYVGEDEKPSDWENKYYLLSLSTPVEDDSSVKGDWNNDEAFNINDIIYYRKYLAGVEEAVPRRGNIKYNLFGNDVKKLLNYDDNTDMTIVDLVNARIDLAN